MTAFVATLSPGGIELLTDAAYYEPDGTVKEIDTKVANVPSIGAIVTGRGLFNVVWRFANAAEAACVDFDELVDGYAGIIETVKDGLRPEFGAAVENYELFLAGYSEERGKVEGWYGGGEDHIGNRAGRLFPMEGWIVGAPFAQLRHYVAALQRCGIGPDEFDMTKDGFGIVEHMRRTKLPLNGDGLLEGYGIGGFLEHTIVTPEGVTRNILYRWPDYIGRKITPLGVHH